MTPESLAREVLAVKSSRIESILEDLLEKGVLRSDIEIQEHPENLIKILVKGEVRYQFKIELKVEGEITLTCATGEVKARVGDFFIDRGMGWKIASFDLNKDSPVIYCEPTGEVITYYRQFLEKDGTVALRADSVAATMLENRDGKQRDARGYFLSKPAKTKVS